MRYDAAKKHHKSIVKKYFSKKLKIITKKLDFFENIIYLL